MIVRECAWCGCDFEVKSLFSRDKYCDDHKKEAAKSNVSKARRAYYKRNKHREQLGRLGTCSEGGHINFVEPATYLGVVIPFSEFCLEQKVIRNIVKRNNTITTIYKGKQTNNNIWIDYEGRAEYGSNLPLGMQITHNYANFDDYVSTSTSYYMENQGPCPECGEKEGRYKDLTRCEIICANPLCGVLITGAPHPSFQYPDTTTKTPFQKYSHEIKQIKWNEETQCQCAKTVATE